MAWGLLVISCAALAGAILRILVFRVGTPVSDATQGAFLGAAAGLIGMIGAALIVFAWRVLSAPAEIDATHSAQIAILENQIQHQVTFKVICDDSPGSEALLRIENLGLAASFSTMLKLVDDGWGFRRLLPWIKQPDRWRCGLWENSTVAEVRIPKYGFRNLLLASYSTLKDDRGQLCDRLELRYLEEGESKRYPWQWVRDKSGPLMVSIAVRITTDPEPRRPYEALVSIAIKPRGGLCVSLRPEAPPS